jgi:hypothetical protein
MIDNIINIDNKVKRPVTACCRSRRGPAMAHSAQARRAVGGVMEIGSSGLRGELRLAA